LGAHPALDPKKFADPWFKQQQSNLKSQHLQSRLRFTQKNSTQNVCGSITHFSFTSAWQSDRLINAVQQSFAVHMFQQPHQRLSAHFNSFNVFL